MSINERRYFGFRRTKGDASRVDSSTPGVPALLVPATDRDLHFASAADEFTDWNVNNPTHPTLYIHSETTPATDYASLAHDSNNLTLTVAGGGLILSVPDGQAINQIDDTLLSVGTGSTARFSWDTTDANGNEMLLQMPAAGAVDVPVLIIGQSVESVDFGAVGMGYNGVVDPRVVMLGVGTVTTGPGIDFRKARGTAAAPTVVTSGDDVGTIRGYAAVAANEYVQTAEIRFDCAGTIATTRGPGTITFLTATDAAPSVLTQAMIISAAQKVTIASGESTGDFKLNLTLTAGADGVGASGEQLTSGGAGAETNWAAAASLREFKNLGEQINPKEALNAMLSAPVYRFHYKRPEEVGYRITTTKDYDTEYIGVVADEAPWAMHYDGRILNPINTFGYTVAAVQALQQEISELKAQLGV